MNKLFRLTIVSALILFSFGFITKDNDIYFRINKSIDLFGRVYKEITLNYVDEIDPENFVKKGIDGMLSSLDPYTNFIDESHKSDIDLITTGKYGGIGATIGIRNKKVTVVDLIEGYSAQRQGMRIGDVIKKVDSVEINLKNYDEMGKYMKGKPGTEVLVTVQRGDSEEPIIFNLIREEIVVKNVPFYGFVPANSANAYIKLSGFSRTAGQEVKDAFLNLSKKKKIKSIVLDLRGNPGGLLDAAIDVSEKFLGRKKLIVTVAGRDTTLKKSYFSLEEPLAGDIKLAVLTNGGSASASEIVSGALQDHDRAVIVGEKSFGKGLVQTVIPLSYNTSVKITTARYYTPSGRSIQKIDYSKNSKIINGNKALVREEFKTDNDRELTVGDGIVPDSIVAYNSNSDFVKNLTARGMFFKFATEYFNKNETKNFDVISNDKLLKAFMDFLKNSNFEYTSLTEKLIADLEKSAEKEQIIGKIAPQIEELKKIVENSNRDELIKYKDDVVREIREELAARTGGTAGRITERLKNDKQFAAAYHILNNDSLYDSFLNIN